MDNASDYGSEESRFDSWLARSPFDTQSPCNRHADQFFKLSRITMTCWEKLPHLASCCPAGQSIPPLAQLGRTLQRRSQERSQSNVFWFQSHTANMEKGSRRDTYTQIQITEVLRKQKRRRKNKKKERNNVDLRASSPILASLVYPSTPSE